MNLLTGTIRWDLRGGSSRDPADDFYSRCVNLTVQRSGSFAFDQESSDRNSAPGITCALVGYVANLSDLSDDRTDPVVSDVRRIARLYAQRGIHFAPDLDGDFVLVVVDEQRRSCFISHGPYGASLPVYYAANSRGFEFSTSLRHLLLRLGCERRLNVDAAQAFLFGAAVVPDGSTFVDGVSKLLPGTYLAVDAAKGSFEVMQPRHAKRRPREGSARQLLASVESTVRYLYGSLLDPQPNLALTSGYDTNYLLSVVARWAPGDVRAFTIGGDRINEVPAAARVVQQYSNVRHNVRVMEPCLLEAFPDIVWRLEGYVCHTGVFLAYELARLLQDHGCRHIILGECADQIVDDTRQRVPLVERVTRRIYGSSLGLGRASKRGLELSEYACQDYLARLAGQRHRPAFDVVLDYILKKSGILLNSFGIQPIYPFLSTTTAEIGRFLGESNRSKKAYIAELKTVLPAACLPHIGCAPGGTDITFLWRGRSQPILAYLAARCVATWLPGNVWRTVCRAPDQYGAFVLKLLFLQLFQDLFIAGRYDTRFGDVDCPERLSALLTKPE